MHAVLLLLLCSTLGSVLTRGYPLQAIHQSQWLCQAGFPPTPLKGLRGLHAAAYARRTLQLIDRGLVGR